MGSLYVMISIPSAEHEKSLLIEKKLSAQQVKKSAEESLQKKTLSSSIRSNKSASNVTQALQGSREHLLTRSLSDDNVQDKPRDPSELLGRAKSAIYVNKKKKRVPLENRLEKCLKELKVPNAVWVLGRAGTYYQVSFCTPAGEQCEQIIQLLNEHEIGVELNSTVSILPCSLYYEGKQQTLSPNKASPSIPPASQSYIQGVRELTAWEQFVNSVRARLMVAQVVAGVKSNAVFTFDFLILLIIASVTSAVGLVENSVVILVASMLISPLMGPVMASTFGFVTKDWKLQNIGVLNELLGLLMCVVIGFIYGLFIGYLSWESPDIVWPTPEMINRGDLRSLCMGALIALLSGAAVAIAVLGNYSGSLTGVAISASLMPPAVNAGLLWALGLVTVVLGDTKPSKLTAFTDSDPVRELIVLGALSLALTFINIVCIFFMGILVLKIKEVTPQSSKDYSRLLWKETIQIARDYKYNMPQSAEKMEQGNAADHLSDLLAQPSYRTVNLNEYTWSPYGALQDMNRPTIQDLASVWQLTLHGPSMADIHHRALLGKRRARGALTNQQNLSQLWNSQTSTYGSIDEHPSVPEASPVQPEARRFTVTPADDNNVFKFP